MPTKRNKLKKAMSPRSSTPPQIQSPEDDELMTDLLTQLDSRNNIVAGEAATVLKEIQINKAAESPPPNVLKKDSKKRHEARQARKAQEMAQNYAPIDENADARIKQEALDERTSIKKTSEKMGLAIHEIDPDGHCLFSAVADQLVLLGLVPPNTTFATTRLAAARYIYEHPDDFLPFLPAPNDLGLMNRQEFEKYCVTMRDTGTWGGEPEILALSRVYKVPIHVVQGGPPPIVVHNPGKAAPPPNGPIVWISYHRRMYGLGEHYNSLRPAKHGISRVADIISDVLH